MSEPILVSACLLGLHTRYDGTQKRDESVIEYLKSNDYLPIPVCPEQMAGLATPREEVHFTEGDGFDVLDGNGQVATRTGREMNAAFTRGAAETLEISRLTGCKIALLKERSPSCGVHMVYCRGQQVPGKGVTAALLEKSGMTVFSEHDLSAGFPVERNTAP